MASDEKRFIKQLQDSYNKTQANLQTHPREKLSGLVRQKNCRTLLAKKAQETNPAQKALGRLHGQGEEKEKAYQLPSTWFATSS